MSVERNICGKRIRKARECLGLSHVTLSEALQKEQNIRISRQTLSNIEHGKRILWDFELVALAIVLEVSSSWLLGAEK